MELILSSLYVQYLGVIFKRHLCLLVLRKLLSLIIPEKKEFLKYKILIRKIFIFPCLWRKCICLQLYPCCSHQMWVKMRFLEGCSINHQGKFAANVFLDRSWTIAICIMVELRGSQLEIHHTWGIKYLIRSPVDFVVLIEEKKTHEQPLYHRITRGENQKGVWQETALISSLSLFRSKCHY